VALPGFDQDLCLSQGLEDLSVQWLVAHRAIEAFTLAVLPGACERNVERLDTALRKPLLHGIGYKFQAVAHWEVAPWQGSSILPPPAPPSCGRGRIYQRETLTLTLAQSINEI
jgi:hypothetical protein